MPIFEFNNKSNISMLVLFINISSLIVTKKIIMNNWKIILTLGEKLLLISEKIPKIKIKIKKNNILGST